MFFRKNIFILLGIICYLNRYLFHILINYTLDSLNFLKDFLRCLHTLITFQMIW
jgi:hypothetical protein